MPVIKVNNTSIHYRERGQGTAIIFIHPPLLSSVNFLYQLHELSAHYRTIAFDIRGHGKSDPSLLPLTYALISQDIEGLMDHLGIEKAFLCGYSTGGTVALDFMKTYPDRVLGGVIISGMSEVSTWFVQKELALATTMAKSKGYLPLALSICFGNANNRFTFWRLFQEAYRANQHNVAEYFGYSIKYNCTKQLCEIKLPTLLIYGKNDKQFLPYGKMLRRHLPNNIWNEIPKMRHQIPTKASQALNQAIHKFILSQNSLEKQTEQDLVIPLLPFGEQAKAPAEPMIKE